MTLSSTQIAQIINLEKWLLAAQQVAPQGTQHAAQQTAPTPPLTKKWSELSNSEQEQQTPDGSATPTPKKTNTLTSAHILGGRTTQEDTMNCLKENLPYDGGEYTMLLVCDGHAGNDVSKWLEEVALTSIHKAIWELLERIKVPLNGHHLAEVLQKVQETWLHEMPATLRGGCTTTILFHFYNLNATASLIVGDGRVYMYDKDGNIPTLEQLVFDGEDYYHHHNSHRITQPCLTKPQVFTGPIFATNGEPQNVGTPIDHVNFANYFSSCDKEEFLEWKRYLLSPHSNPLQILQFPQNVIGNSWRIPNKVEPTRVHAPDPKKGGEEAMRFGVVTWTDLPDGNTIHDYSYVIGCDGLEDLGALNPQIISNLLCDHKLEFQNYYDNHRFLCNSSLQISFSTYEKTHPRPPRTSPLSEKLDWILSSANGLGPLCTILDAQWIRSIKEARDIFYDYEQGKITMTIAEIIAQYAAARFTSDNVSLFVDH